LINKEKLNMGFLDSLNDYLDEAMVD